jgi:quaternary ammonium compound-resistance protein SugE
MDWLLLIIAGLFEIVWATGLKYTEGFTKTIPSLITGAAMFISFWLLSLSLKTLPMGTAYAVWTGVGIVGTVIFGILWADESASLLRIGCILLILAGIIGLKFVEG